MDSTQAFSPARLLFRSLMPSITSVVYGLFASIVLIALHILFVSLSLGSIAPKFSSDEWIQSYTNFIIRPVEIVIHDSLLNTLLTAVVWGFVGLVIYSMLEAVINAYRTWGNDKNEVRIVDAQRIELHPLRRGLLVQTLWRMLISFTLVLLVILTGVLSHYLLLRLDGGLNGHSVFNIVWRIGLTIFAWTGLIHLYVVELRLFMFRTRLFGEVIH